MELEELDKQLCEEKRDLDTLAKAEEDTEERKKKQEEIDAKFENEMKPNRKRRSLAEKTPREAEKSEKSDGCEAIVLGHAELLVRKTGLTRTKFPHPHSRVHGEAGGS